MIVSLELTQKSKAAIARHAGAAGEARKAFLDALGAAVVTGGEEVRESLALGRLGLRMRHPGSGLAASVMGWLIDPESLVGAIGVPSNSPAARYAAIHEFGGTITPKSAKALAVPISAEAREVASPRDMTGLTLMPRKGKPPLLVRLIGGGRKKERVEVHWVLLPKVEIQATHWLSEGVRRATKAIARAAQSVVNEYVRRWKSHGE